MVEADILAHLFGVLQDKEKDIRQSAIKAIAALAKFGRLIYQYIISYCARTDNPADDFCSKMVEVDVLARLFDVLQDEDKYVNQSAIKVITALAKFGRLIYHFVLCKD
jgi:HEAT repeat protein